MEIEVRIAGASSDRYGSGMGVPLDVSNRGATIARIVLVTTRLLPPDGGSGEPIVREAIHELVELLDDWIRRGGNFAGQA